MKKKYIAVADTIFELLPYCSHLYFAYKNKYDSSNWKYLSDCYKNPSFFKMIICENMGIFGKYNNCTDFRISSYNKQFFTAGMRTTIKGEPYILIFTPRHNYIIEDFHND